MGGRLERKIGRLLIVGFRGATLDDCGPIAGQIRSGQVGGVVLYDFDDQTRTPGRNIRSPEQVRALVSDLHGLASGFLLVGIDQEGGRVNRLKGEYGFPPTLSQQELGRGRVDATGRHAAGIGATLRRLGIDVNFAPVVDVDVNPQSPAIGAYGRSFSDDPSVVADHARAAIEGYHEGGVLTAIKHFPGHGSADTDSHRGFVDITGTWSKAELDPYRLLVGDRMADMVMTAHVFHQELDPQWPATLSPAIITGILRDQLGFAGVVVADDLQMGAIADRYELETALRQALLAGVDLLMFANNNGRAYEPDIVPRVIATIASLVHDGVIAED
ncbi:MAG: glycoside hydrolase family 3 N-terminal domain-containing protein, partial [Actinomycetota bacterium]